MEALKNGSEYIFPNSKGKPLSDASTAAVIDRMNEQEQRWIDPKVDRDVALRANDHETSDTNGPSH